MLGTFALEPVGLAVARLAVAQFGVRPVLLLGIAVLVVSTVLPLLQADVRRLGGPDDATAAEDAARPLAAVDEPVLGATTGPGQAV